MSYAAVSIGLFIFIMAYFTMNAPVQEAIQPTPPPAPVQQIVEYCQSVAPSEEVTFNAPRDDNTKCPGGPGGSYKSGGVDPDNIFTGNTTYKLIRRNVPLNRAFFTKEDNSDHSTLGADVGIQTDLDPAKYRLYFPQISGEINLGRAPYSRTRDCGDKSYENTGRMYFIDYGLAFGLVLKDGKPIEVSGTAIGGGPSVFWLADVFKDVNRDDEIPPEAFNCNTTTNASLPPTTSSLSVNSPAQQRSADSKQLQMEYFLFGNQSNPNVVATNVVDGWVDSCKPAVYLYPENKQLVNVKVSPKGELSYTRPLYNPTYGWTVTAYPDGVLEMPNFQFPTSSAKYPYLYYESKLLDSEIKKPAKGWVVKFDRLEELFNKVLPSLGLNKKEQNDFMSYWLDKLPNSPYYFVGLVDKPQRDYLETLTVTPAPDTSIRFSLYFEALDQPKIVEEPQIQTPIRTGFTLVDWGGMVKLHPGTPFTCSQ